MKQSKCENIIWLTPYNNNNNDNSNINNYNDNDNDSNNNNITIYRAPFPNGSMALYKKFKNLLKQIT